MVLASLLAAGLVVYGCANKTSGPVNPVPTPTPSPAPPSNTPFDSGLRSTGFVFVRAFPVAGAVPYYCIPHGSGGMTGTVTVSAGSGTDTADVVVGPSGSLTFSPASVTVKVGGYVRWTWGSSNHTVTSGTPTVAAGPTARLPGGAGHSGH
jgi:plastocyanin